MVMTKVVKVETRAWHVYQHWLWDDIDSRLIQATELEMTLK